MRRWKIARQLSTPFLRLAQLMPALLNLPRRIRYLVRLVRHQQRAAPSPQGAVPKRSAIHEVIRKPARIEEPRIKPLLLHILPLHQQL